MSQHRREAIEWILMAVIALVLATFAAAARGQCAPGQSCGPNGCPLPGRGVGVGIGIGVGGWGQRPRQPRQEPLPSPAQDVPPAACRIGNSVRGSVSYGTGTLVQYDGLVAVITVRHLFSDGAGELQLTFPGGQTIAGSGVHTDATGADLAVILVSSPPVAPLAIAADHPMQGDRVRGGGFGPTGQWQWISGQCLGYVRDRQGAAAASCFEISSPARQGDSGGPVLNDRGEVCGVIWGTDRREAIATYSGKVRPFLARVAAKVGRSPSQPTVPTNPPAVGPIEPTPETPAQPTPGQQAGQPQPPPQIVPQIQERLDSLARTLEQQATASGTLAQATNGLDQRIADRLGPVIAGAIPAAKSTLEAIIPAIVGSATGVGVPAAAFWALAWLARRRKAGTQPATARQGSQPQEAVSPSPAAPVLTASTTPLQTPATTVQAIPVVVESPPLPQHVVTQREFVQVAQPCNACKATKMAHDLYVQRYPGSGQGTIAAIEEYAKQFLSGLTAGSASTSS